MSALVGSRLGEAAFQVGAYVAAALIHIPLIAIVQDLSGALAASKAEGPNITLVDLPVPERLETSASTVATGEVAFETTVAVGSRSADFETAPDVARDVVDAARPASVVETASLAPAAPSSTLAPVAADRPASIAPDTVSEIATAAEVNRPAAVPADRLTPQVGDIREASLVMPDAAVSVSAAAPLQALPAGATERPAVPVADRSSVPAAYAEPLVPTSDASVEAAPVQVDTIAPTPNGAIASLAPTSAIETAAIASPAVTAAAPVADRSPAPAASAEPLVATSDASIETAPVQEGTVAPTPNGEIASLAPTSAFATADVASPAVTPAAPTALSGLPPVLDVRPAIAAEPAVPALRAAESPASTETSARPSIVPAATLPPHPTVVAAADAAATPAAATSTPAEVNVSLGRAASDAALARANVVAALPKPAPATATAVPAVPATDAASVGGATAASATSARPTVATVAQPAQPSVATATVAQPTPLASRSQPASVPSARPAASSPVVTSPTRPADGFQVAAAVRSGPETTEAARPVATAGSDPSATARIGTPAPLVARLAPTQSSSVSQPSLSVRPAATVVSSVDPQVATLGPTGANGTGSQASDRASELRDFVRGYDDDGCFLAVASQVSTGTFAVSGFSRDEAAWLEFNRALDARTGVRLTTQSRQVSNAQCAALGFARRQADYPNFEARIALSSDRVANGAEIRGAVEGVNGREVTLLLVDDEGLVQDASRLLQPQPGGTLEFGTPLTLTSGPVNTVQLFVALVGDRSTAVPQPDGAKADAYFSDLTRTIAREGGKIDVAIAAFSVDLVPPPVQ